jgi:hypothetical protein
MILVLMMILIYFFENKTINEAKNMALVLWGKLVDYDDNYNKIATKK